MRLGRWVNAEPAADFAALEAVGLRKVLAAALAALLLVISLLRTWVSADPAADFAALLAVWLRSVLLAADAARFPVDSDRVLLGISYSFWLQGVDGFCCHLVVWNGMSRMQ